MSLLKKSLNKVGQPPGFINYTGDKTSKSIKIELITYEEDKADEIYLDSLNDLQWESQKAKWVNVYGLNNSEIIKEIGDKAGISSLVLEDIVHVGHRPKVEFYDGYIFLVLKMLSFDEREIKIKQEQVSFILLSDTLITFQEYEGDVFNPIRKRIRENKGIVRKKGIDYLLYCLIDEIIDNQFILLNNIEGKIEEIEERVIDDSNQGVLEEIYKLRKELLIVKASVWPVKDIIYDLIKEDSFIEKATKVYLKDVNDHVIQVMDFIVIYNEMIKGIFDTHLSNASNHMNKIMTTLTIFSAIFIPLTFLAGIYGMNFDHIPELSYKYGYPIFLVVCLIISCGMFFIFKKKKWM